MSKYILYFSALHSIRGLWVEVEVIQAGQGRQHTVRLPIYSAKEFSLFISFIQRL